MTDFASYEVMRNALDQRYGLWAAVFSMAPRTLLSKTEIRGLAKQAICSLIEDGDLYLFVLPGRWGAEQRLTIEEVKNALEDDNNWRPRKANPRKLVRLGCTEKGRSQFLSGAFGEPEPMISDSDFVKKLLDRVNGNGGPDIGPLDQFGEPRY
ncbi:MAG: hypothetical protein U0R49_05495 [Fimbriimonadales bacterium]